jgi:hypothetical protein
MTGIGHWLIPAWLLRRDTDGPHLNAWLRPMRRAICVEQIADGSAFDVQCRNRRVSIFPRLPLGKQIGSCRDSNRGAKMIERLKQPFTIDGQAARRAK